MSRITEVIKNKNKVEKIRRTRNKEEISSLKNEAAFKARLYYEIKKVAVLLESNEIESVVIKIPEVFMAKFGAAIYSDDLAEYDIQQVENSSDRFYVKRKFVSF